MKAREEGSHPGLEGLLATYRGLAWREPNDVVGKELDVLGDIACVHGCNPAQSLLVDALKIIGHDTHREAEDVGGLRQRLALYGKALSSAPP
jgi:hypothetical protein